jgi:predicted PolB exonuclease-like 3'-5' exonuclease
MATVLVFDIETIPDIAGLRRLEDYPDSMSDAQVAAQAMADRAAKTGSEFLPLYLQKIIAISCVIRRSTKEGAPQIKVGTLGTPQDDEKVLIQAFFDLIEKYTPQLVSWNGSGFDLPVLHYRALANHIAAPRYWEMGESQEADSRDFKWNNYISRYHMRHLDMMDLLAKFNGRANAPLDGLAKLCGFPGKMGMDGSQVWPAYQDGKIDDIRRYCETDVVNTYLMYCRFQLLRGGFSLAEYQEEIAFVKAYLEKELGGSIQTYRNNDELYAAKGIDAVFISTADFQHALHTIEAVKAGCDTYTEKPLAETMEDNRAVLKAVKDSGKVVQIGSQRRSGENYWAADEFIKSGKFGDIKMVELSFRKSILKKMIELQKF